MTWSFFLNFDNLNDELLSAVETGDCSLKTTGDDSKSPRLQLTPEEKRLLEKEGVTLSSHYPLTKDEENELKKIQRKIHNKKSAQESRKRKKEYIDGLEERVKHCTEENLHLAKCVEALEAENQILAAQVKELQAELSHGAANTAQILRLNQSSSSNYHGQKDQDLSQPENKMAPLAI